MDIVIIAHFVTEFKKDGTSRFVYIAEELSRTHDVELVTSTFSHTKKKQRSENQFDLKTKVTLLKEPSYPKNVCLGRIKSHVQFGKEVKKYLESRKKPDVIYCAVPSLDAAYYAAQYAKENHIEFIIDVQDVWPEAFKMVFHVPVISNIIFYPMKKRADQVYAEADKIVAVSKTYCDRAKAVNQKNADCIPVFLGTKLEVFDQYAAENKAKRVGDKFVLGYCGTLGHSYDIKCVIDAMAILKKKGHENVSFWVMGDGPLKESFEDYAREKNVDVVFYGRLPYNEMCGLLVSCDACLNCISKGAAQSVINKHGDYAASGIPVISTQETEEYRNLLQEYRCGINCECANAEDVANAIVYLMEHEEERAEMGKNARKLAEELFDRNKSYENIYRLFS